MLAKRRAVINVHSMTGATKISLDAISLIIGGANCISSSVHTGIRTTVHRLGCVPGRLTHGLCHGHAGAVNIVVPAVTRPFFTALATRLRHRFTTHSLGALLYSVTSTSGNRNRCISVLRQRVVSNVIVTTRARRPNNC